jgi:hypothetical protein
MILPVKKKSMLVSSFVVILLAVFLSPLGLNLIGSIFAAPLTVTRLTISDSRASGTAVTYDFAYTTAVTTAIKQVTILLCTTPSGACTVPTGITTTGAARASDNLSGTGRTDTLAVNGTLTTVVTTALTQSPQAVTMSYTGITNPSTNNTSFFARITTFSDTGVTTIDNGVAAAAILTTTSIAVTATVDSTFTFTVAGVASGGTVNSATTDITTTANTIPFGVLNTADPNIGAHDLTVVTNASGGYTITVRGTTNPVLVSGSNNIDEFSGTNASPTTWSAPAGVAASVNTGLFGYSTNDATLGTGTAARFTTGGGNRWAGTTTSPLEVAFNAAAVTTETTRVGWQAEINSLQPFGSYAGTVILVATPTY